MIIKTIIINGLLFRRNAASRWRIAKKTVVA